MCIRDRGMCDALFVELNHELDILPGAWWSCYSDAPDSRSAMCAAIMRMLDKETGNKWRTHICPKIQELDKLTNKPYDEKYTQMHPVINHEVLYFWSQLRGQLRGLYGTHYRLSLIHISEPTRLLSISYAVFCLKKKKIHM
eukprot:TRINITY_DN60787_c0_g1_i1.p1 TRINITY_DN60787_c0_g1~~TRINITY_DN60787_c0_g1_i1.p1  ORF type:complete len:141 (+),score=20.18 TRINITY_DN60787_c0_g1_i1:116-538(+)